MKIGAPAAAATPLIYDQMKRASRASPDDVEAADRLAAELAGRIQKTGGGLASRLHNLEAGSLARLLRG